MFVLKGNCGKEIFNNGRISLYKGSGRGEAFGPNAKNNGGLILVVKREGASAIFSGDCGYSAWPAEIELKGNKILVIPHHGASMDLIRLETSKGAKCTDKVAYISVGQDAALEKWDHPNNEHVKMLEDCGYKVELTCKNSGFEFLI